MKILVHHHAPVYRDPEGRLHLPAFIGKWVECLAAHSPQIGLLLPETTEKQVQQDFMLQQPNIQLHALPAGGRRRLFLQRKRRIARICRAASPAYDLLLVRGITPRQWTVWQHCLSPRKAFLLVGSLRENRPAFGWNTDVFLSWLLGRLRRAEFGRISRQQGAVLLANSPRLVHELREDWQVEATYAGTNTLSAAQIPPFTFRETGEAPRLLFVGRVVHDKGMEELLQALALLPPTVVLTIVGQVSGMYRPVLDELCDRLGISHRVEWRGFIPFGETLLAQYRRADLFVLPSWHEGFPHSLWEAAAMSLPVVTTPVGGIPGLVDERMVTFARPRDPADLVRQITVLLQDRETRKSKAESFHAFAGQHSVEAGVQMLFEQLAQNSKGEKCPSFR